MKLRYKKHPDEPFESNSLNTHAMFEVLTGDDTVFGSELDCWLEVIQDWMDLTEAFRRHLVITDNYNQYFREARTIQEVAEGYYD